MAVWRLLPCLSLLLLHSVLSTDLISLEIQETESLLSSLRAKQSLLSTLKAELIKNGKDLPVLDKQDEKEVETYKEMEEAERHSKLQLLRHMRVGAGMQVGSQIVDLDILSTYSSLHESILIALCSPSGQIHFLDQFGSQAALLSTNRPMDLCAFSSQTEEIRLAVVSNSLKSMQTYRVLHVFNRSAEPTLVLESDYPIYEPGEEPANVTSLVFFPRLSKKNWIATDTRGGILNYHYNGTLLKRGETGMGEIVGIEKSAQQLTFVTRKQLASYHIGGMEVSQECEKVFGTIEAMAVEQGSPHVYVSLSNGDILVYDMKFAPGHGVPTTCKGNGSSALYRFPGVLKPKPWVLATAKGNLLSWSEGGFLTFVNTSYIDSDRPEYPVRMQVLPGSERGKPLMDVFRYQNGTSFVILVQGSSITYLEASLPTIEVPSGSFFDFNFGNFRVIA